MGQHQPARSYTLSPTLIPSTTTSKNAPCVTCPAAECDECAASTDSKKRASAPDATPLTRMGVAVWISSSTEEAPGVGARGMTKAPAPRTAKKRQPSPSLAPLSRCPWWGRLGQASTPSEGSPCRARPRATQKCSPRMKPLVPSIGSRIQVRAPPAIDGGKTGDMLGPSIQTTSHKFQHKHQHQHHIHHITT